MAWPNEVAVIFADDGDAGGVGESGDGGNRSNVYLPGGTADAVEKSDMLDAPDCVLGRGSGVPGVMPSRPENSPESRGDSAETER